MTFHGKFRGEPETLKHAHESPLSMTVPLALLAIGALFAGLLMAKQFIGFGGSAEISNGFWNGALPGTGITEHVVDTHGAATEHGGGHHDFPMWVLWAPFVVTLGGFILAWLMYIRNDGAQKRINAKGGMLYNFLLNKWYIDELYEATIVRAVRKLGDLFWKIGDVKIIDGLGPNGFAAMALAGGKRLSKFQSGYLYHYAFVMLVGLAGLVGYIAMKAAG